MATASRAEMWPEGIPFSFTNGQGEGICSNGNGQAHAPVNDLTCPAAPSASSFPLALHQVLERFEKEAVRGICDTGRYRCPYFSWGSGPPLVFVHGLCDDAKSFVLPIASLSEDFRCIAYDLPLGREDGARLGRYRHADLVKDLLALLDHLQLDEVNVLGSSFGSTITLAAMHQQPRRFARAVFQGGFARRPLAPAEVILARWARYWPWSMRWLPFRLEILKYSHSKSFSACPPEVWQFFLERDATNPMNAVAHRALILHQADFRHLLQEIHQPILLVCGDFDPLVSKDCEADLLKGLRNVVRAEIEGCGHMPQFTHPTVLAEVVRRFLLA
jgi:pimeloyl-ACP methyl ester carboxylesterase